MQQIKCPHCGEVFTIDESNYNSIVSQIRDHTFNEEFSGASRNSRPPCRPGSTWSGSR